MIRITHLFGCCLLLVACSNDTSSRADLTKGYVAGIERDSSGERDACAELGLTAPCDLCDALGWYEDDVCDDFCRGTDPECALDACGGFAGIACAEGFVCVDNPADDCDPSSGGADCAGLCRADASDPAEHCGGIAGFSCPVGYSCADDPSDECDPATGGADCLGVCRADVPTDPISGASCGGLAGLACPVGQVCVDDDTDSCQPDAAGADCLGVCEDSPSPPAGASCGGIAAIACPSDQRCVDDPSDTCDPDHGGADCLSICVSA